MHAFTFSRHSFSYVSPSEPHTGDSNATQPSGQTHCGPLFVISQIAPYSQVVESQVSEKWKTETAFKYGLFSQYKCLQRWQYRVNQNKVNNYPCFIKWPQYDFAVAWVTFSLKYRLFIEYYMSTLYFDTTCINIIGLIIERTCVQSVYALDSRQRFYRI